MDGHRSVIEGFVHLQKCRGEMVPHQRWMEHLGAVIDSKEKAGAGGGLVAGVGWLGDNRVTEKDLMDYMVKICILNECLFEVTCFY